jgi:hypothetical protein
MKRFITGGILAMGLISQAHAGAIYGGIDPTDTGAIYGSSGTDSHTIVRPPHVRPPSNNTGTTVALADAGGTGASGVCCSDLPAQQSEVLIASAATPPIHSGGGGGDNGEDKNWDGSPNGDWDSGTTANEEAEASSAMEDLGF